MNFYLSLKLFVINNLLKRTQRDRFLFDHHFFKCKYFLHKSASETHMANILNISIEELNNITINHYSMRFNDLCEKHKFEHFWDEVTNPLNADLPVHSIIESSGFSSNSAFNETINSHKEESKNIISKKYI